ncbi:MAG TPA: hypothetical protein VFA26_00250, partial [Gemmataceae bacterium]|nr:hypothetical protein [Gemmataceae bacterium]
MWREAFVWTAVVVGAGAAAAQIPPSPWPSAPPAPAPFNPGSLGPTSGPLGSFVPAQPGAPPRAAEPARPFEEQLTPFDWRLTDLRWGEQGWQLVAGDVVLKDFGRREHDGTEALRIIRELRLNQRGTVGSPRPIMEYWLSDGQAPQGPVSGARTLPIDRNTLRVEKVLGHWWLRDSARGYFNFGIHEDDARQALAVMQHHRFSRVALVGQALPLMLIFLAEPDAATPSPLHGPAPLHAPGWPPA